MQRPNNNPPGIHQGKLSLPPPSPQGFVLIINPLLARRHALGGDSAKSLLNRPLVGAPPRPFPDNRQPQYASARPYGTPVPSARPYGTPIPSAMPYARPYANQIPSARPCAQPIPSAGPYGNQIPSTRPYAQPIPSARPYAQPIPSARPYAQPIPSARPYAQPIPSARPYAQPIPSARPYAQPIPSAGPYAQPIPSARPYAQPIPSAGPYGNQIPSARPYPQPIPSAGPYGNQIPSARPYAQPIPSAGPYGNQIPSARPYIQPIPSAGPYGNQIPSAGAFAGPVPSAGPYTGYMPRSGSHKDVRVGVQGPLTITNRSPPQLPLSQQSPEHLSVYKPTHEPSAGEVEYSQSEKEKAKQKFLAVIEQLQASNRCKDSSLKSTPPDSPCHAKQIKSSPQASAAKYSTFMVESENDDAQTPISAEPRPISVQAPVPVPISAEPRPISVQAPVPKPISVQAPVPEPISMQPSDPRPMASQEHRPAPVSTQENPSMVIDQSSATMSAWDMTSIIQLESPQAKRTSKKSKKNTEKGRIRAPLLVGLNAPEFTWKKMSLKKRLIPSPTHDNLSIGSLAPMKLEPSKTGETASDPASESCSIPAVTDASSSTFMVESENDDAQRPISAEPRPISVQAPVPELFSAEPRPISEQAPVTEPISAEPRPISVQAPVPEPISMQPSDPRPMASQEHRPAPVSAQANPSMVIDQSSATMSAWDTTSMIQLESPPVKRTSKKSKKNKEKGRIRAPLLVGLNAPEFTWKKMSFKKRLIPSPTHDNASIGSLAPMKLVPSKTGETASDPASESCSIPAVTNASSEADGTMSLVSDPASGSYKVPVDTQPSPGLMSRQKSSTFMVESENDDAQRPISAEPRPISVQTPVPELISAEPWHISVQAPVPEPISAEPLPISVQAPVPELISAEPRPISVQAPVPEPISAEPLPISVQAPVTEPISLQPSDPRPMASQEHRPAPVSAQANASMVIDQSSATMSAWDTTSMIQLESPPAKRTSKKSKKNKEKGRIRAPLLVGLNAPEFTWKKMSFKKRHIPSPTHDNASIGSLAPMKLVPSKTGEADGTMSLVSDPASGSYKVPVDTQPSPGLLSRQKSSTFMVESENDDAQRPISAEPLPISVQAPVPELISAEPRPISVQAPVPEPISAEPWPISVQAPVPEPISAEPWPISVQAPVPEPISAEPLPISVQAPVPEHISAEPRPISEQAPVPEPISAEPRPISVQAPVPEPISGEPRPISVQAPVPEPISGEPLPISVQAPVTEPISMQPSDPRPMASQEHRPAPVSAQASTSTSMVIDQSEADGTISHGSDPASGSYTVPVDNQPSPGLMSRQKSSTFMVESENDDAQRPISAEPRPISVQAPVPELISAEPRPISVQAPVPEPISAEPRPISVQAPVPEPISAEPLPISVQAPVPELISAEPLFISVQAPVTEPISMQPSEPWPMASQEHRPAPVSTQANPPMVIDQSSATMSAWDTTSMIQLESPPVKRTSKKSKKNKEKGRIRAPLLVGLNAPEFTCKKMIFKHRLIPSPTQDNAGIGPLVPMKLVPSKTGNTPVWPSIKCVTGKLPNLPDNGMESTKVSQSLSESSTLKVSKVLEVSKVLPDDKSDPPCASENNQAVETIDKEVTITPTDKDTDIDEWSKNERTVHSKVHDIPVREQPEKDIGAVTKKDLACVLGQQQKTPPVAAPTNGQGSFNSGNNNSQFGLSESCSPNATRQLPRGRLRRTWKSLRNAVCCGGNAVKVADTRTRVYPNPDANTATQPSPHSVRVPENKDLYHAVVYPDHGTVSNPRTQKGMVSRVRHFMAKRFSGRQ